jgi:hypothetical protein
MRKHLLAWIPLMQILVLTQAASTEKTSALFPLGRSWVGDRDLPRPFGVGLNLYHQNQDYDLESLTLNLPDIDMSQASAIGIKNVTDELDAQVDLWLLPFLNLFAILGRVQGNTTVIPGPPLDELQVGYDGLVYGGGATLAAGTKWLFGSVSAIFTQTHLNTSKSSVEAWILTPRVGVHLKTVAVWVGAMYQHAQEHHQGNISLPFYGDVSYDVQLEEKEPWNYLVGVGTDIGEHWRLEVEAGFGNRKDAVVSIGYRF